MADDLVVVQVLADVQEPIYADLSLSYDPIQVENYIYRFIGLYLGIRKN